MNSNAGGIKMGKDNTIDFDALQRIKIVTEDFRHDKNVGLVTGAVKTELKDQWLALFDTELEKYKLSNAMDYRFIKLKAYLLSLLFNLTSGVSVSEAWTMFECLNIPEEYQKTIVALAIKFSPRGNALRLHLMSENAKKNIRVAR